MGLLINIDTGGTLTDFCVIDGERVYRTKSVTTPYDLSKCLFDGLRKASTTLYGEEDLQRLLAATDYMRYSTTQGTNALVERKGPRLGLLLLGGLKTEILTKEPRALALFRALVDSRSTSIDASLDDAMFEREATLAVNRLAGAGATRLVVSGAGANRLNDEQRLKRILLRAFPPQMLGALPILYGHELVSDADDVRRTWSALFNAFLHPPMERFLYSTEHRLRDFKIQKPLLIFRNDGNASRVARTAAIKTYSSGPRGGAEGLRALAAHYKFDNLAGIDVGGTTTDIVLIEKCAVRTDRFGSIEGIATSIPLCNVTSVGVGGSSIIRVENGLVQVGPESVGSTPGPACFGLGGTQATITDAFLLMGLLDPATYFGGELALDAALARRAVEAAVGTPLGLSLEQAVVVMENAWVAKIADSLLNVIAVRADTVLAAFGGAGPLVATRVADAVGIERVLIPGLAAVFSAFGVGFSDVSHQFEEALEIVDAASVAAARATLVARGQREMFAEGVKLEECTIETHLLLGERSVRLTDDKLPDAATGARHATLVVKVTKAIPRVKLAGQFSKKHSAARAAGTRHTLTGSNWTDLPLYRAADLVSGAGASGPAVLEEAFFTSRIDAGWSFELSTSADILLTKKKGASRA